MENLWTIGALPRTQQGEFAALPRPQLADKGLLLVSDSEMAGYAPLPEYLTTLSLQPQFSALWASFVNLL